MVMQINATSNLRVGIFWRLPLQLQYPELKVTHSLQQVSWSHPTLWKGRIPRMWVLDNYMNELLYLNIEMLKQVVKLPLKDMYYYYFTYHCRH